MLHHNCLHFLCLSLRFGDISLQERINQKNFEMLEAYYKSLSEKVPIECKCRTFLFIFTKDKYLLSLLIFSTATAKQLLDAVTQMWGKQCMQIIIHLFYYVLTILWSINSTSIQFINGHFLNQTVSLGARLPVAHMVECVPCIQAESLLLRPRFRPAPLPFFPSEQNRKWSHLPSMCFVFSVNRSTVFSDTD